VSSGVDHVAQKAQDRQVVDGGTLSSRRSTGGEVHTVAVTP
jgi:hypothetical protein